jgi:RNA polymerase sigma-70 factor (ECF subfamily)
MSRPVKPAGESADEIALLASAKSGNRTVFQQLTEPHRRELQLHCYRMMGSFHDAEDLVQETFLRAWRGLQRFDGHASIRYWLYRIATNACLNALATRSGASRFLPETRNPPTDRMPDREPAYEIPWLEPYPDSALEGLADRAPGPDARYETREAVHLAFIAAIQLLAPRQRAVLLLHDVLGWSAIESAQLLDSSPAAVNSALQRARSTLEERLPIRPPSISAATAEERALLERYVRAWETTDVDGFVALLRDDTVMSMPPWRQWYRGRSAIGTFFAATGRSGGHAPFRLVPTAANKQPAFAFYSRWQSPDWRFHSIQLLVLEGSTISRMTSFVMPEIASVFGLPAVLPTEAGDA